MILPQLEEMPGLKIGRKTINDLRYTVLIAENEKDFQNLLNVLKNESIKKGLDLKSSKSKVVALSKKITHEYNITSLLKLKLLYIWALSSHKTADVTLE